MGLFWHVPGYSRYSYDERHGSAEFFLDERPDGKLHFFVIDGGEGILTDKLIADLNLFGAKREGSEIWTLITHGHYDHYYGIRKMINHKTKGKYTYNITRLYMYDPASLEKGLRDNKGSGYVRAAISTLYTIKKEAEARGIKVIYVKNKQAVTWGTSSGSSSANSLHESLTVINTATATLMTGPSQRGFLSKNTLPAATVRTGWISCVRSTGSIRSWSRARIMAIASSVTAQSG